MDANSEARLAEVHPELARLVRQMADMLATENIQIRITQGLRSWHDQRALWLKGRNEHGAIIDPSAVVTHAAPGYSWHQFGLAVDAAPFDDGIPDWNSSHPAWKRIEAVGQSCGLFAGATFRTFPDCPHFQLTGKLPVSPTDEVRQTFLDGGMQAVWNETGLTQEST